MSDVLIRIDGRAGRITLNRPKALNAVTWEMVRQIDAALWSWRDADAVDLVIIDAAGERAFAAGGDIVDLYAASRGGDLTYGRRFWDEEYQLNIHMAHYPKPIVSLMHGFTMGGGVGISCHCSHRVVDESVQIAMPECGIGLIPDVGGSWLCARAPHAVGQLIGLTGHRMGPGDAIFAGFADSYVPRDRWPALITALCETGDVAGLAEATSATPESSLRDDDVTSPFGESTVPAIAEALKGVGTEAANGWHRALCKQSPLSVVCAQDAISTARDLTLAEAFAREYRFVWRAVEQSDFLEGIRAQVIDKDRKPRWRHSSFADVTAQDVASMLAPLGEDEWSVSEGIR